MNVNHRRYERLHFLFGTFRRDQLEALREVLDGSQWIELMSLYREMSAERRLDGEEALGGGPSDASRTTLVRS